MKRGIAASLGIAAVLITMPAAASASATGTPSIRTSASTRAWASRFTGFGSLSAPINSLFQPSSAPLASAPLASAASPSNGPNANGDVYCYGTAPPVVPHDLIVPPDPTSIFGGNLCFADGTQVGHDVIIEAPPSGLPGQADVLDAQNANVGHDVVVEAAPAGEGDGYLSVDTYVGHDVTAADNSVVGIGGGTVGHDVSVTNPLEAEVIANSLDTPITRAVIEHSFTVTGSSYGVIACGANVGHDVVLDNDFGMIVGDSTDQFDDSGNCYAYGGGVQIGHDFEADNNNGGPFVDISDNSPDNPAGAGGIGHDFSAINDTSTGFSGPIVENNAIAQDAVCNPPATTDGPDVPNQVGGEDDGCNAWVP